MLLVLLASCFSALRALSPRLWFPLGRWLLPGGCCPPPPPLCLAVFVAAAWCSVFFSPLVVRPRGLWLSLVSRPGCPGPRRCVLFALLASSFSALRALSPLLCLLLGCWLLPGGCCPPFVSRSFCRCRLVLCFFFSPLVVRPRFLWPSLVSGPGCPGPRRCVLFVLLASRFSAFRALSPVLYFPPARWLLPGCCCPPPLCLAVFVAAAWCLFFFFSSRCLFPRCLWLSLVSGAGCLGPRRCVLFALLASRFSALRALSPVLCFPPGRWLLPGGCCPPPPPLSCLAVFVAAAQCCVPCAVLCCVCLGAVLLRAAARWAVRCCAVVSCAVLFRSFWCRCLLCRALWCCPSPWGPVLCGVLWCSPALCALRCVCFVVACWCPLLFAAVRCAVCVLGCCAVSSLSSPLCVVLCFLVLVRLCSAVRVVRAVVSVWCGGALLCVALFPLVFCGVVPGLVARGCLLAVCFGVGVPVCLCGLLPCGWCGLLWCPASLCRVLWCCAVPWCCAVVLCCCFAVLSVLALPSCGLSCCAVLRCWLSVLLFARWWCLRAVVPFPYLPARTKNTDYYPVLPRARLCVVGAPSRRVWSRRSSLDF